MNIRGWENRVGRCARGAKESGCDVVIINGTLAYTNLALLLPRKAV